eukprot:359366-Chlamydomonas_euryale.AAC.5
MLWRAMHSQTSSCFGVPCTARPLHAVRWSSIWIHEGGPEQRFATNLRQGDGRTPPTSGRAMRGQREGACVHMQVDAATEGACAHMQ